MVRTRLHWRPIAILMVLAMTWGANMAFIKIASREVAPLFQSGLRSLVASGCIYLWMRWRGVRLFPAGLHPLHGVAVGLLFGAEFALIYLGLQATLASRTYILVYTAPFFAALGAHWFLPDDRLHAAKTLGLVTAFCGVSLLFFENLGTFALDTLHGDAMAVAGGALWAATTLYIKKYMAGKTVPLQTVFYQLFFSAPLLLGLSLALEDPLITGFSPLTAAALFYQCIVVASISFIFWFELVHRYPISLLHAFTFFVPVFGVLLSGVVILREPIHLNIVAALILVGVGTMLANRRPPATGASS